MLWRDLRSSIRSLGKSPTFTAAVIATLAIGIGATTLIFSVVNGVLLKPLAYPGAERLIALDHRGFDDNTMPSSPFLHFTYRDQSETFEANGLWNNQPAAVTGLEQPLRVPAISVTAAVLPLLGIEPAHGRVFSEADDLPKAPLTTVLTYGYWQQHFGGDPAAVGQLLTIDGAAHEIIGVMPEGFRFLDEDADLFRPLRLDRSETRLGMFGYIGIARLRPGVTLETASADAQRLVSIGIDSFPPFPGGTREQFRSANITPDFRMLKDDVVGDVGATLWVLMGTISIVLLIACANVANLFLIRAEGRVGELAVRAALGAGRWQLARTLLAETLLIAAAGGIAGLGVAWAGLQFVLTYGPENLPRMAEIEIDAAVLAFATAVAVLTAVLFGGMPALRNSLPRFTSVLRSAGRGLTTSREGQRARASLVVVQVALALLLMIGSGLLLRTFLALSDVEPGFTHPGEVQTFRLNFAQGEIPDAELAFRAMQQVTEQLAALPGVSAVSFASSVPLGGQQTGDTLWADGVTYDEDAFPPARRLKFVAPGFFSTLGIPMLAGRDLAWIDHDDRRLVAVVSESLAREQWGSAAAAIGERVRTTPEDPWREIVGVVGDVHEDGLARPQPAIAYFPVLMDRFWTAPTLLWRGVTFAVRTPRAGTDALLREMQSAVWSVNGNLPLAGMSTLGDLYERSLARTSFTLVLLGVAGVMALSLALVGIYAVIAYGIAQRTREIGIRLALGASRGGVQALFARQALGLVAVGALLGVVAATGLSRLMESLLFGVPPLDPVTFVAVPGMLAPIAALASFLPARNAMRIDPMEALRYE